MNDEAQIKYGLTPVASEDTRVLILGSMPGERSLREQKYYAHPGNHFWKIMGELVGATEPDYDSRCGTLLQRGIALWDVARECEREGSLDAKMSDEVPNDFESFFANSPDLRAVFFNGKKAEKLFDRLVQPRLGFRLEGLYIQRLPSTSPANAKGGIEAKIEAWKAFLKYLRK